jgi:hypothetical protein
VSTPLTPPDSRTSGPRPCPAPSTTALTEDFASVAADADNQRGPFLMFHKGPKQIRSPRANNNRWISFSDPEGNEFDLVAG